MNRIRHQSTGVIKAQSSQSKATLTHKEFMLLFKKRMKETFDTEVENVEKFCDKPVANCYSLFFEGTFIMVHYEELTPQSSLLNYQIYCRCMHRNLMLAVKWMEAHLNDGVLRVSKPDKHTRVFGDVYLTGTQISHHSDNPGLNAYLNYIKHRILKLKFSMDGWFLHSMPGFNKGLMLQDFPKIGCGFIATMYYVRDFLEEMLMHIPADNHEFDDFIYFSYLSRKEWAKALNYVEKEVPDYILGMSRIIRANRNVFRRIRCLLGMGKVKEAEDCLNDLEDCPDDDQYTRVSQDTRMRVLYMAEKFDELLDFIDGPEALESPRIDFWKSMSAIKMNDVDAAIRHCLAYEKECGFDLLLRHKISHRFAREFKEGQSYSKYLSNIELLDDHGDEKEGGD